MYVIFQFRSPRRSSTSTKKVAIQFLIGRNITKYCVSNLLLYKALVLKQYVQAKKENSPLKNSSYFEKWNFLTPILKNFLYILLFQETSNKFYTFHEMVTLKKLLIFRKMELFSSRSKKFLLFSRKKAFPTFRETETLK